MLILPFAPPHRIRSSAKSIAVAECTCKKKKSCMVGCDVLRGVASKSQLKVRLRCKACHAEERLAFHSAPRLQLRIRITAKPIAACKLHRRKILQCYSAVFLFSISCSFTFDNLNSLYLSITSNLALLTLLLITHSCKRLVSLYVWSS